jgi:hypothetical protein
MKRRALMTAVFLGLAASPLLAHGGGPHLRGTVSAIAPDQITVKDAGGRESQVKITPQTLFMQGKAMGKPEDLHQGDRVVVHTRRKADGLEAVEVHYGAARRRGPKSEMIIRDGAS